MTTVNFYQLDQKINSDEEIHKFVCDLIYENYNNNLKIYILCQNQVQCYYLDETIINYHEEKFFPYQIIEFESNDKSAKNLMPPAQICLGTKPVPNIKYGVLINLSNHIPSNFLEYKLIIELVIADNIINTLNIPYTSIAISREHYKHYLKHQCQNNHIKII